MYFSKVSSSVISWIEECRSIQACVFPTPEECLYFELRIIIPGSFTFCLSTTDDGFIQANCFFLLQEVISDSDVEEVER